MSQQYNAQNIKKRISTLVFLKGPTAPLVLYVENPQDLYAELTQLMKSTSAVLVEKETQGPLKKVCSGTTEGCCPTGKRSGHGNLELGVRGAGKYDVAVFRQHNCGIAKYPRAGHQLEISVIDIKASGFGKLQLRLRAGVSSEPNRSAQRPSMQAVRKA